VGIIGRYGSGKSSLLYAILGEMKNAGGSKVVLNGKVAYASQKPFIISGTVRNNILFGAAFNHKKYN
jgi:ABC-type transport system involved in cytochrome bd biosynthesis fused ATPase/permease subunit